MFIEPSFDKLKAQKYAIVTPSWAAAKGEASELARQLGAVAKECDVVGRRCRMSQLYIEKLKRSDQRRARAKKRGRIIAVRSNGWIIRVQWDDSIQPISYGKNCIEAVEKK